MDTTTVYQYAKYQRPKSMHDKSHRGSKNSLLMRTDFYTFCVVWITLAVEKGKWFTPCTWRCPVTAHHPVSNWLRVWGCRTLCSWEWCCPLLWPPRTAAAFLWRSEELQHKWEVFIRFYATYSPVSATDQGCQWWHGRYMMIIRSYIDATFYLLFSTTISWLKISLKCMLRCYRLKSTLCENHV